MMGVYCVVGLYCCNIEAGWIGFHSLQSTLAGSADTEMNESSIVRSACGTDVGGQNNQRQTLFISPTRELSQRNSSHVQINSFLSNLTPFHCQGVTWVWFTVIWIMGGKGMCLATDTRSNDSEAYSQHKDLLLFHANGQHSHACPLLKLNSLTSHPAMQVYRLVAKSIYKCHMQLDWKLIFHLALWPNLS